MPEKEVPAARDSGGVFSAFLQKQSTSHKIPKRKTRIGRLCLPIKPEGNNFLYRWDLFVGTCLLFVCFISPFEVAFLTATRDPEWVKKGADWLFWANRIIDTVFVVDIGLQFFIMYPVSQQWGQIFISDHGMIIKNYLRTWFVIDIVSVLPFDILGLLIERGDVRQLKIFRVVRLLRLLKLARLVRGLRMLQRWELEINLSYRKTTLYKLLFTVLLASHWISCTLGIIANVQTNVCGYDNDTPDCQQTWWSPVWREMISQGDEVTIFQSYTVALYEAATIIIHPLAYSPKNAGERIPFVLLIFIGGFIWARIISRTTALMTSMDRHTIHYHQTMDDLNEMVADLKLKGNLTRRLRGYFVNTRLHSHKCTWRGLNDRMSPALRMEVNYESCKVWVRRLPYFKKVSKCFLQDVSTFVNTSNYAQGETFGDNFTLYIMKLGLISWSKGADRVIILRPGAVWGEEHLFLNNPELLRPNTATCFTFAEVLSLGRKGFKQVCDVYSEYRPQMRKYYLWYAMIRTILFAAEQMQSQHAVHFKNPASFQAQRSSVTSNCSSEGLDMHYAHYAKAKHVMLNSNLKRDSMRIDFAQSTNLQSLLGFSEDGTHHAPESANGNSRLQQGLKGRIEELDPQGIKERFVELSNRMDSLEERMSSGFQDMTKMMVSEFATLRNSLTNERRSCMPSNDTGEFPPCPLDEETHTTPHSTLSTMPTPPRFKQKQSRTLE